MILTNEIIRNLIKEEIEKQMSSSEMDKKMNALYSQLSGLPKAEAMKIANSLRSQVAKMPEPEAAASEEIDEACGHMQSIDMSVDHHEDDHEGNMAKRQMFKTAEYATEIFDNIHDDDVFPAWIQSKMTKIADYISVVKHYLEYDHVMGEAKLTKKQIKRRDDDAKTIMKSTKKQYGKEEGESAAYAIATNIQKEKAKKKK